MSLPLIQGLVHTPKSRSPEALLAVSQLRTTQSKFSGRSLVL